MKIVIASLDSGGFLYPGIAIAQAARRAGHSVRVLTSAVHTPLLHELGLEPLVPELSSTRPFDVRLWGQPETMALQLRWLERGIGRFGCDAIVSQPLMMGAALASEVSGIPLVQLGSVISLWRPGSTLHAGFREKYDAARTGLGLPQRSIDRWLGDVHLVQGVPELDAAPPRFVHVGRCAFEPSVRCPGLDDWIAAHAGRPIIYAHLGRTFSTPSALRAIASACDAAGIGLLVATDRTDDAAPELPASVFVAPEIPLDEVLPRCAGVISGGHPAAVAAALSHGVPLLLVPSGSGTPEIARACKAAGVALVIDGDAMAERIRDALDDLLGDARLQIRAQVMRRAFARYDAPVAACAEIERAVAPPLARAAP